MKTKLLNIRFLATTVFFVFAFMLSGQDYNSLETKFNDAITQKDHDAAIQYGQQLINNYKQNTTEDSTSFATILDKLAWQYFYLGNHKETIRLLTQAMEIRKKTLGMEHPDYANSLSNLANYYYFIGNYAEAIRLGTQAMEIRKKTLGIEHQDYAQSLSNLAKYYSDTGNYAEAIRLGTQAMEIIKKTLGMEHPDYATSLGWLEDYYSSIGNYAEAIRLGTQVLEIYKKTLGMEHLLYAQSLKNLADYYYHTGNYAEAIRLGTEAMEKFKKTLGMEDTLYTLSLKNLADYYLHNGNYAEAIRLGTQAMEITKKILGMGHPGYAQSLNNLALYYSHIGNYAEAIRLGTQAMEITKKTLGMEDPNYATSLDNLAGYYSDTGNYAEAIRLETQAMEIRKNTLGMEHPDYALSLNNLARDYSNIGNYAEAFSHISEATNIYQSNLLSQFSSMTSLQRQQYWSTKEFTFFKLPGYAMRCGRPESASIVYDKSCLFAKGLLLSAETGMRELILESCDEQALRKFEELQATRAWLRKLYETPIAERQVSTDSLEAIAERQEAELVQMSAAFGDFMRNLKLTWKDVQAKLGDKDIAVEFLSFPLIYSDSTMYIALTLKKGYDSPRMIPLFELQQLKDIKTSYYNKPELSQMIWGKLADELEGVQNVYFSPSGELYNIGIESMPDFNVSGSLLNERFNFYRLSSTRELATTKRDAKEASGATIYGGINYNTDVAHMGTPHKEDGQIYAFNRGFDADSAGLRGSQIGSLAGTLEESNKIDSILTAAHVQVDKLTGDNATETSLKNMSGKHKRMMHIATHGFYWSESEAEKKNTQKQLKFLMHDTENNQQYVEDKAMTRSGLLFCGAQNTFNGDAIPEGVDDGVLTAQEISQIDLRGLDLLVLSACQTGLGEISGDGVFGLQRGFKKAGAQTIVMSLWKVSDVATRDLMVQFYNGLTDGLTKRQAFLKAQQYVKDHDKTYPYTYKMRNNPHWAAFILLDALQ